LRPALAPGMPAGGPQIWRGDSPAIILGHIDHFADPESSAEAAFRIYTPDSRLRVKLTVLFVRDDPSTFALPVSDHAATLWIGEEEHDFSGKSGADLACTDVLRDVSGNVVHQSSPLTIPEDPDLEGFTTEFVTAADSLVGKFTTGQQGPSGIWTVQLRFQPDGQRLCDQDWDFVCRKCHGLLLGPQFDLFVPE
jgi:hypothetical protein